MLTAEKLGANRLLRKYGIILTDRHGRIFDIVDDPIQIDSNKTAGALVYSVNGTRLDMRYIRAKPESDGFPFAIKNPFRDYKTKDARKRGIRAMQESYEVIAGHLKLLDGIKAMRIMTSHLAEDPGKMEDPDSFFFGWKPYNRRAHERAVEYLKGQHLVNEKNHLPAKLIEYVKDLK